MITPPSARKLGNEQPLGTSLMDMTGERRIPAPRRKVWDALNDPDVLKASIPGCQSLEKLSDQEMKATAAVKIGPISARFSGNVQLSDLDPPNGYRISGEGQGGVAGFAKGGANVQLTDDGGDTLLIYEVHAQVGGKIAQLGARLIDATAKNLADQFFERFSNQVAPPAQLEPDTAARPVFPAAPQAEETPTHPPSPQIFPSAPSAEVAEPVLPPPDPHASVSMMDMVPREPFGFPLVVWIGGAVFLAILLLFLVSIF